ncbi:hypothetical protein NC651_017327 [Populus alba x Populus x berolinensis]|nr:hypothetical protein NC651_017327 [Populus alba x Populus x berolinensis]
MQHVSKFKIINIRHCWRQKYLYFNMLKCPRVLFC